MELTVESRAEMARQVRRDALRMVHGAKSGHPGGALSVADYLVGLYFGGMHYSAKNFSKQGVGEDHFYLSNGHVSAAWYSVLARSEHFPVAELATFRRLGTRLQGHPTPAEGLPGIRVASGSLGQGLSVACGVALSKRLAGDPGMVFSLHGDGELQEGQIWEAALFASHHKLGNLVAAVDVNGIQIDGPVAEVMSLGDLSEKWRSFGWEVSYVPGHDPEAIADVLAQARLWASPEGKPRMLLLQTTIGRGVSFMEGKSAWHGKAPNDDELEKALHELGETNYGDY